MTRSLSAGIKRCSQLPSGPSPYRAMQRKLGSHAEQKIIQRASRRIGNQELWVPLVSDHEGPRTRHCQF